MRLQLSRYLPFWPFLSSQALEMAPFDETAELEYAAKYTRPFTTLPTYTNLPNTICYINFTGFRTNWGCQATSWEFFKFINDCLPGDISPTISILPLAPASALDIELNNHLDAIYSAFQSVAENRHDHFSALAYLERLCVYRYGKWIEEVKNADVIVFQAEGTMSGRKEFRTGAGIFLLPFVAKHAWGKRIISMNQTLYFTDRKIKGMVGHALSCFDLVAVREPTGAYYAAAAGLNVMRIPDMAFLTKPCPSVSVPRLDPNKRYFAVTGSALKEHERYSLIFEIASAVRDATSLVPILIAASDPKLIQLAAKRWNKDDFVVAPQGISYHAVAALIEKSEFLLGGRYHMGILAATVGTPLVLLRGNTPKNEGLAAMLSWPFPVRSISEKEAVISDIYEILAHRDKYRYLLESEVQRLKADISAAKQMITNYFAEGRYEYLASSMPMLASPLGQYYAEVADNAPLKLKRDKASINIPTLEDILDRLLRGIAADPRGTQRAVQKILAPGWETRVSSTQRKRLEQFLLNADKNV